MMMHGLANLKQLTTIVSTVAKQKLLGIFVNSRPYSVIYNGTIFIDELIPAAHKSNRFLSVTTHSSGAT